MLLSMHKIVINLSKSTSKYVPKEKPSAYFAWKTLALKIQVQIKLFEVIYSVKTTKFWVVISQIFCGILKKPQLYLVLTPNSKAMIQYFSKKHSCAHCTYAWSTPKPVTYCPSTNTIHFPSLGEEMVSIVHTDFYPPVNNFLLRSSGQSNLFSDLHMSAYFPLNCQNQ